MLLRRPLSPLLCLLVLASAVACQSEDGSTPPSATAGAPGAGQGGAGQAGSGGAGSGGSLQGGAGQGGQAGSGKGGSGPGGAAQGGAGAGAGAAGKAGAGQGGSGGAAAGSGGGAAGEAGQAGEAGAGAGGAGAGSGGAAAGAGGDAAGAGGAAAGSGGAASGSGGAAACGTPAQCAAEWEQKASDRYDLVQESPEDLDEFLVAMPKGGDLHNHLSGSIYAETMLAWGKEDGNCINSTTYSAVFPGQCSATNLPTPGPGPFYTSIVKAWSMEGFVPGAESGHDHFFATFGKFGLIAGGHRDESLADFAARAASENVQYLETMFNIGKNIGTLAADTWSGTLNADDLPAFYDKLMAAPTFASELSQDVKVVDDAAAKYRAALGCSGSSPPAACGVAIRFIAQVSRTGAKDTIFGQLVSAFEIAAKTKNLVGVNLSSPEDDVTSLKNYTLHMQMLDFLHEKYKQSGKSPLHITLHAGELAPKFLPSGYETANTFHIRQAIDLGHAERIGHGIDVLSETDSAKLLADMASKKVLVEVCLSSNIQILEVSGPAHPLGAYLQNKVPIALATDDLGVSRSSLKGEFTRAALDQKLSYRQLKRAVRESLEHSFLPGDSLWASLDDASPVSDCQSTPAMGVGDPPSAPCKAFLDGSERAAMQWELERRFRAFESKL